MKTERDFLGKQLAIICYVSFTLSVTFGLLNSIFKMDCGLQVILLTMITFSTYGRYVWHRSNFIINFKKETEGHWKSILIKHNETRRSIIDIANEYLGNLDLSPKQFEIIRDRVLAHNKEDDESEYKITTMSPFGN